MEPHIVRTELTVLERAEQLEKRKALYEVFYPETKAGAAQGAGERKRHDPNLSEIISPRSFADDSAGKLGVTPRSVQQDVAISKSLERGIKQKVRGTDLADDKSELMALSKLSIAQQHAA